MENLFIARQPIYDQQLKVIGYELLYRNGDVDRAIFDDHDQASCETILNTFMHIGIDNIAGSALVFINLPDKFLLNETLTPMFREQTVLEVLEHVTSSAQLIDNIRRLKAEGYRVALDDFNFRPELAALVELADYVKIDVLANSPEQIEQELEQLRPYSARIIAEKVETQEMYSFCQQLGFRYYQGFFFCKPQTVRQKHVPAIRAVVLNLLGKLQHPEVDYDELEDILAQDVSLSYKLLRYINSAMFSLRREVDSIKDAVVLLGLNNVRQWLSLILMSRLSDAKPDELILTALIRARMCENLAEKLQPEVRSQMFIIGLFSILDALMDTPMIELLDSVILSTPVKLALLDKAGPQGDIYQMVLDYEHFNWDRLSARDIPTAVFVEAYIEAIEWANANLNALARAA